MEVSIEQRTRTRAQLPPFWSLVEAHGSELLAHARRLAGDDAEDVVQEALLKALRSYPRLAHSEHLRAWLYRVTTTTAFDLRARERRAGATPAPAAGSVQLFADEVAPFEELIEPLSPALKKTLELRFVEDLRYEEIGRRLGCNETAARQRVSSALRALRRRMT